MRSKKLHKPGRGRGLGSRLQGNRVLRCWLWRSGLLGDRTLSKRGDSRLAQPRLPCFLSAGGYDHRYDHEPGDYEANAGADPESIEHREQQYQE